MQPPSQVFQEATSPTPHLPRNRVATVENHIQETTSVLPKERSVDVGLGLINLTLLSMHKKVKIGNSAQTRTGE